MAASSSTVFAKPGDARRQLCHNIVNQNWVNTNVATGSWTCATIAATIQANAQYETAYSVAVWKGGSGTAAVLTFGLSAGRVQGFEVRNKAGDILGLEGAKSYRDGARMVGVDAEMRQFFGTNGTISTVPNYSGQDPKTCREHLVGLIRGEEWCGSNEMPGRNTYNQSMVGDIVESNDKYAGACAVRVWKGQSATKSVLTLGTTAGACQGFEVYDIKGRSLGHEGDKAYDTANSYCCWIDYQNRHGTAYGSACPWSFVF